MALEIKQIQELLTKPQSKQTIAKAVAHEQRLRFHVETEVNDKGTAYVINDFLRWVKGILPESKFHTFIGLFKYPISTNELAEQIFHALEKVFDGRNPFFSYEFTSPDAKQDWLEYKEIVSSNILWETKGFEMMKAHINSVMIVDLPKLQSTERPEPYFYWKNIDTFHDIGIDRKSNIEYVMFIEGEILYVIDDTSYRVFILNDKKELQSVEPELEENHELNYCPARFFWTDFLKSDNKALKKSPLSNQLTNFDKLQFQIISKEHLDLYASYPIYWGYEVDCEYKHPQNGEFCDGGFIKAGEDKYVIDSGGSIAKCPLCSDKRLAGVGTFVEVPMPDAGNDIADMREPVGLLQVDKGSLEYNRDEVQNKRTEIYDNVVGRGGEMPNQAVNKDQVKASFERPKSVIMSLKKNFELARSWVEGTMAEIRYGDLYIKNTVNLGTEFHFHTPQELAIIYKEAKEAGLSDSELDSIQIQRIESVNRNNPEELSRSLMLLQIEPFRHMSKAEVLAESKDNEMFNSTEVAIKLNFSNFIARFERENTPINEFGLGISFEKRVNSIIDTLKTYVNNGDKGKNTRGD